MSILFIIAVVIGLCVSLEVKGRREKWRNEEKERLDSLARQNNSSSGRTSAVRRRVGLLDVPLANTARRLGNSSSLPVKPENISPMVASSAPSTDANRALEVENHELMDRCARLGELISMRFHAEEIAATRYRSVLSEVRLGMLSNLDRRKKLRSTVQHLNREDEDASVVAAKTEAERQIHLERLKLLDDVNERIDSMAIANKQALHRLDHAIVVLTDFVGKDGYSSSSLEASLADLEGLVAQAHSTASGIDDLDELEITLGSAKRKKTRLIKPDSS